MSKFTKLIKSPKLFFYDALSKRLDVNRSLEKAQAIKKLEPVKNGADLEVFSGGTKSINPTLVVIDNLSVSDLLKQSLIKYQLRSILKYLNINDICYISQEIKSSDKNITVYKNYDDFYNNNIKCDNLKEYIFISLEFIFTKPLNVGSLYSSDGRPLILINPNRKMDKTFEVVAKYCFNHFQCSLNLLPTHNICVSNSVILKSFHEYFGKSSNVFDYLFNFIPLGSLLINMGTPVKMPIAYMNMKGVYIDKLQWLLSVRGAKNCPLGLTISNTNNYIDDYVDFLDMYLPHTIDKENKIVCVGA